MVQLLVFGFKQISDIYAQCNGNRLKLKDSRRYLPVFDIVERTFSYAGLCRQLNQGKVPFSPCLSRQNLHHIHLPIYGSVHMIVDK